MCLDYLIYDADFKTAVTTYKQMSTQEREDKKNILLSKIKDNGYSSASSSRYKNSLLCLNIALNEIAMEGRDG